MLLKIQLKAIYFSRNPVLLKVSFKKYFKISQILRNVNGAELVRMHVLFFVLLPTGNDFYVIFIFAYV